jgi:hypothetical protein
MFLFPHITAREIIHTFPHVTAREIIHTFSHIIAREIIHTCFPYYSKGNHSLMFPILLQGR